MEPHTEQHQISKIELFNKRIVLFTMCGIGWMLSFAIAWLAVNALPIPDSLDRLVTFVLGNISGALIQTGLTSKFNGPTAKEYGESVVEASKKADGLPVKEAAEEPKKADEVGE